MNENNLTKEEALKLFDMPKIVDLTQKEIEINKSIVFSSLRNLALEGMELEEWYKILAMEIARGEQSEEMREAILSGRHKERCTEKAKYGSIWIDVGGLVKSLS